MFGISVNLNVSNDYNVFPFLTKHGKNHDKKIGFRYGGKTCPSVTNMETRLSRKLSVGKTCKREGQECRRSPVLWDFIKLSYFSVS